jgi:hypothetical protein
MSIDLETLERRLAALETAVADIQKRLSMNAIAPNWIEQVAGIMDDIPEDDYRRFQEYCREFRNAEYPTEPDESPESAA